MVNYNESEHTVTQLPIDKIENLIVGESYTKLLSDRCVVCELILANGYIVRGIHSPEPSSVIKTSFGEMISRANAKDMIPDLEEYLNHQRIYDKKIRRRDNMSNEAGVEELIQEKKLNAPRLRPEDIEAVIVMETYTKLPSGKCLICEMTLKNGFTVRGESACVSKENFDMDVGKMVSRDDAKSKIWQLEGYLLQQRLHDGEDYNGVE